MTATTTYTILFVQRKSIIAMVLQTTKLYNNKLFYLFEVRLLHDRCDTDEYRISRQKINSALPKLNVMMRSGLDY